MVGEGGGCRSATSEDTLPRLEEMVAGLMGVSSGSACCTLPLPVDLVDAASDLSAVPPSLSGIGLLRLNEEPLGLSIVLPGILDRIEFRMDRDEP